MGDRQLIEKLSAFHFVAKLGLGQFMIGRVGNGPGEIVESEPGAGVIKERMRTGQDVMQVTQNGAARGGSQEVEKDGPEEDHDRPQIERHVR